MATIYKEVTVDVAPDRVWAAVRDVGAYHQRLFPGVLTATRLEPGARVVTFDDGREVREPIVAVDDAHRRVAWTVTGGPLAFHHASMQVVGDGAGPTRLVWITDVLPDEAAPMIAAIVERGAAVLVPTLERG
ncbi:MAG TPA: SRPBCC family protein [Kofleriaceae bacterium]|jgi:carbon monoxide dehydrogenase subunit G|nr:SRPBCC family protein [Kofleriaceae bacterium]